MSFTKKGSSLVLYRLIVLIMLTSVAAIAQDPPGQYSFTSTRAITREDIDTKELSELKIIRNEIFARHGHIFKGEDLKKHFGAQDWYKPKIADATALLTPLEKKNVEFIKKWETRVTTTSDFDDFYQVFSKAVEEDDMNKLADLVFIDFIESIEKFKQSYDRSKSDIQAALSNSSPTGADATSRMLPYGEFYNGVQYQFIKFEKHGCCWYIYAFLKAG